MARTPKSPKQRKVSLWLAVKKPSTKKMQGVDILKDLCGVRYYDCLLYTSPSPRDRQKSRMPSSA